jgi:hypothetical protein
LRAFSLPFCFLLLKLAYSHLRSAERIDLATHRLSERTELGNVLSPLHIELLTYTTGAVVVSCFYSFLLDARVMTTFVCPHDQPR